ncbi:hypothetical protein [Janthinobacterium fluminis]|uniref:Uncharacterized protein n=1 Tax=Janthinobacterium fluminis TaxID=2987524 RepID=A0ABT5K5T7_9BURK|nr:hypothetical protein [Janthinobacterium fluminis]MDC8760359.1 hypothetical protein [Janthinobacterium fluminis]
MMTVKQNKILSNCNAVCAFFNAFYNSFDSPPSHFREMHVVLHQSGRPPAEITPCAANSRQFQKKATISKPCDGL